MYNRESIDQRRWRGRKNTESLLDRPILLKKVKKSGNFPQNQVLETQIESEKTQLERIRQELEREKAKNRKLSSTLAVTQKQLKTLQTKFTQNLATTIERKNEKLWLEANLAHNIANSISHEELLSSILKYLHNNVPCDIAGIFLVKEQSYELFIDSNRSLSITASSHIQQTLLDKIAHIRDNKTVDLPICLHLLNSSTTESAESFITQIGSHYIVPIMEESNAKGKILGLLYVAREESQEFSDYLIQDLYAIAERGGYAIAKLNSIPNQQLTSILEAEHNRLETEKMRRALNKEKELNELKTRIIRIVSHEYRTPLTIISLATDLLESQHGRLSETQKETCFRKIRGATQQMRQLLEETTLVERTESEDISFNPLKIDITVLCERLISDFNLIASEKHQIHFQCEDQIDPVYLDPKLVQQILNNLLSNGIKYSPMGGSITLELKREQNWIVFDVSDSGIGIPSEDWDYLFDCFHRASNVGTIPGTGLGLTVVKKCVDFHGGKISLRSQLNVGTTFTVKLPLTESKSPTRDLRSQKTTNH